MINWQKSINEIISLELKKLSKYIIDTIDDLSETFIGEGIKTHDLSKRDFVYINQRLYTNPTSKCADFDLKTTRSTFPKIHEVVQRCVTYVQYSVDNLLGNYHEYLSIELLDLLLIFKDEDISRKYSSYCQYGAMRLDTVDNCILHDCS